MAAAIRVATQADADAIAAIYAPIVEQTGISFEETPPSSDEMAERIGTTLAAYPWIVCESDGAVVGYAYASAHHDRPSYRWGVDVSVYIDAAWRRRGIGRGLYDSLLALLRAEGFYTAYAIIVLPNEPSVALHEALGFTQVGRYENAGYKLGQWRDVGHWEYALRPPEPDPPDPIPFETFRTTDDIAAAFRAGEDAIDG